MNWVNQQVNLQQRAQMDQARRSLGKLGRYAEMVYFKNPANVRPAMPEELAGIAIELLDRRPNRPPLHPVVRQWAFSYLADKFHRRGIHHTLSPSGGELPVHQRPEKFGLDTPVLRSADHKFFQIPPNLFDKDMEALTELGMLPDVENALGEFEERKALIARQRGVLDENGQPGQQYVMAKSWVTSSPEQAAEASHAALVVACLPHTERFTHLRANVDLGTHRHQFTDLAPIGDLFNLANDVVLSDLPQAQQDKLLASIAVDMIATMADLFAAPTPIYPCDWKLENLLLLESGFVSPCDLDHAHLGNDLCTTPEASVGYQDSNIFVPDRHVFARDAAKYSLGAALYVLLTKDDPPGLDDDNWSGYQHQVFEHSPPELLDIAKMLMHEDPTMRPEPAQLMFDPRFGITGVPVHGRQALAEISQQVPRCPVHDSP